MQNDADLRHLVACVVCHRQFDASGQAPGARFHCSCGQLIEVQEARPHKSAVVRCSACGAPRLGGTENCSFCSADFTIHERDLDTICPSCATRISRNAKFCHACAVPITPQGTAGTPVAASCPACGDQRHLVSRALETQKLTVLECPHCAGLFLGNESFQLLEDRARERQLDWTPERQGAKTSQSTGDVPERIYRPCPDCDTLMHRRNYGKRSGVIVDVCSKHGIWFDLGELERILRWIRDGGLARSQMRDAEVHERMARPRPGAAWPDGGLFERPRGPFESFIGSLLGSLLG